MNGFFTYPLRLINYIPRKIFKLTNFFNEYRWAINDSKNIDKNHKVLFVDLGANLGQSYKWFKKFFNHENVNFELFEPNPNCCEKLNRLPEIISGKVKLHKVAAGSSNTKSQFYGIFYDEGGKYSEGGSIVKEHDSYWQQVSEKNAISVDVINFSEYVLNKKKEFDKIIVKMDIEGAEVDLLENLIETKMIHKIDVLYVEFHSEYQSREFSNITKNREDKIINNLSKIPNLKFRIWH